MKVWGSDVSSKAPVKADGLVDRRSSDQRYKPCVIFSRGVLSITLDPQPIVAPGSSDHRVIRVTLRQTIVSTEAALN